MTAAQPLTLPTHGAVTVDEPITPNRISLVVPVKNNQRGINRLLSEFSSIRPAERPSEIILVDNDSTPPLRVRPSLMLPNTQILRCVTPGPGAARNHGATHARGSWLLFTDSDCVPTRSSVLGFAEAQNGAVAYAGLVKATGRDLLARYYGSQKTLVPPPRRGRPSYLVTANALVWKQAFDAIGGFDERFRLAGGEDIDLAIRLSRIGALSFAPEAVALHHFNDGVFGFVRRFIRYGSGNRMIQQLHGIDLAPRFFWPVEPTPFNVLAAATQVVAMRWGYARPTIHH